MLCPDCGAVSDVILVRHPPGGTRRRRECFNGHRFTTMERVSEAPKHGKFVTHSHKQCDIIEPSAQEMTK